MVDNQPARNQSVDQFFDALTPQYAAAIERCFPRYREMLWALLDYLPTHRPPERILELGSGTGNLSVLLAQRYPKAEIHVVDISPGSVEVCRDRLGSHPRFHFYVADFRELRFDSDQFGSVVSSIAVHHLTGPEKRELMGRIFRWLDHDGIFAYADQHAGATDDLSRRHTENWKAASMAAGSTTQEWSMWMDHQAEHDHHDTMVDQIAWLREAGFPVVDCPWRYLLWTVLQARKSSG